MPANNIQGTAGAGSVAINELNQWPNVIWQPLYSSVVLPATVTGGTELKFFNKAVGDAEGTNSLTEFDTNVQVGGQIPNGEGHIVFAIAVTLWDDSIITAAKMSAFLQNSRAVLSFTIRQQFYLELPLYKFTSGHGVTGFSGTLPGSANNGAADPRTLYTLVPRPVKIGNQVPYGVSVRFEADTAAPAADARLFIYLEGLRILPVYK